LKVLTGAYVNKLLFAEAASGDGERTADAVQFTCSDHPYTVKANKEVLLCTGAIKSPQILELSGIGSPEVLEPLGIPCHVPLPGVGNNVQEHIAYGVSFELDSSRSWETLDVLKDPEVAAKHLKLFDQQQGLHMSGLGCLTYMPSQLVFPNIKVLIASQVSKLEKDYKEGKISEALWDQYNIQLRYLQSDSSPDVEIAPMPQHFTFITPAEAGKSYYTFLICLTHPFSRGTIHITSIDPAQQPEINPHYFEDDFDMQLLVEALKHIRRLSKVEPFNTMLASEVDPGSKAQTDDEIRAYIKNGLMTLFHTCGTCSMLPREKGGVVSPELKVYGTTNVRVVDMSIIPLLVAAHTQAVVYGLAEQAADLILSAK